MQQILGIFQSQDLLLVVAILFLIFTITMMIAVVDAITSSTGKIARMKIRANRGDAQELAPVGRDQFHEMFGGDTGPNMAFHWFLPWIKVQYPGMQDAVMGYEYDPAWGDTPYQEADEDAFDSEPSSGLGAADGDMKTTTLRAGGAAVPVPPLVPPSPSETDISSSRHSVSSSRSMATGTRKRSSSKTRSQEGNGSIGGGGDADTSSQKPELDLV